jgi:hypothetical protein
MQFALNVLFSALVISAASWASGRYPIATGFIVALPLTTMLVLPLSYAEHGSSDSAVLLAKSILVGIPISLGFFLPFVAANRFGLSFVQAYALGCAMLPLGFLAHRAITRLLFGA